MPKLVTSLGRIQSLSFIFMSPYSQIAHSKNVKYRNDSVLPCPDWLRDSLGMFNSYFLSSSYD